MTFTLLNTYGKACAVLILAATLAACNTGTKQPAATDSTAAAGKQAPAFATDSAYANIERQISFGPRVPGTPAQEKCAAWLTASLRAWADTVYVQRAKVQVTPGKEVPCINIIAAFNPAAQRRILLLAHWDTRPRADKDAFDKTKPMDGADDGASGAGILLETARQLHARRPEYGIDLLLTDAEDYDQQYCLGTQYWARNPHVPGYKAEYGILLDMVGGRNATFFMEGTSRQYAYAPMKMFWDVANNSGHSSYFSYAEPPGGTPYIEDDHTYVNQIAKIPTFDVIAMQPNGSLMPHHHTTSDNLSVIDPQTLRAVGQTLLNVLYGEPFKY
ncbi:M28 family peptidase [Chitinophaga lutea]|uniref:M28 family peptidase n=1 Tax=Chitinophaga lutea TaxID=2488634 RepID=A0A3N4Q844_9BACT|nr:M28 family peptidase [Chitinophaga lutea]RPE13721.1 M28 family peptidase [Chitinophaga lutea]